MSPRNLALAGAIAALGLGVGVALAADNEAGVPLNPTEAVGGWTVETSGHAICMLRLTEDHKAQAGNCGDVLPAGVAGWVATHDGMALTGADGQVLAPFNRWSNSLFVSHRSTGVDVQLMRGAPNVPAGTSNAGLTPAPTP